VYRQVKPLARLKDSSVILAERGGHGPWQPCLFPDKEAFWLVAEDLDDDPLTYGISGSYRYFFSVTPDTGQVKLAYPLDYEVDGNSVGRAQRGEREGDAGPGPQPAVLPRGARLTQVLPFCRHSTSSPSPSS
jgi:hypothetical protein